VEIYMSEERLHPPAAAVRAALPNGTAQPGQR
jgi:hypothetical protein